MIAIESYTAERWDPVVPWGKMDTMNCYRLVFGMPSINTVGGMHDSVKWITGIEVQLVGSPPDDWGTNDPGDVVGSDPSNTDNGDGEGEDKSNDSGDGKDKDKPDKPKDDDKEKDKDKPDKPEQPEEEEQLETTTPAVKDTSQEANKVKYTVTYHPNGGSGNAPAPVSYDQGSAVVVKDAGSLKRDGYVFLGWSGNKKAGSPRYEAGDILVVNSNVDLYAVWKKETAGGGDGSDDKNTGKSGPLAGHGENPGVASDGKADANFGGGQNPSIEGGITMLPDPGMAGAISGDELMAAGDLTEVDLRSGGLSDANNPWVVYEISPDSEPLKLPPPKDGTLPIARGLLGGAFAVGGLYNFTSLSAKSLWVLRQLFFIK
jgi:hypothetical protein